MEEVSNGLHNLNFSSGFEEISKFINVVDDGKSRKKTVKLLEGMRRANKTRDEEWYEHLAAKLKQNDTSFLKKVSALLEIPYTCEILQRLYEDVLIYLKHILQQLCGKAVNTVTDIDAFNALSVLTAKVSLQVVQYIPNRTKDILFSIGNDDANITMKCIVESLLVIICSKGFSKDASLLCGTTLGFLFNLYDIEESKDVSQEIMCLIKSVEYGREESKHFILFTQEISLPEKITSVHSQISLINGLVTVGNKFLCHKGPQKEFLLKKLLDVVLTSCLKVSDATSKYICFKTIYNWLIYLSTNDRLESLLKTFAGRSFFLDEESEIMQPLLNVVKHHIEDLVDGVPQYTQKIFGALIHLQRIENNVNCQNHQMNGDDHKFAVVLCLSVNQQAWFMKGRWMLFSELVRYIGVNELIEMKDDIVRDLIKCLTTCSLPAISNEVYLEILKEIKEYDRSMELSKKKSPLEIWALVFLDHITSSLLSESSSLRQNVGQYWLPSTFRIFPECFELLERNLSTLSTHRNFSHSQIIIIKAAWNIGELKSDGLEKRKVLLRQSLKSMDLDVRIEAFNIVCSNPKKTEPIAHFLQALILEYIQNNLNCDSSKFRQQMFSALKRLLLNVRDSSVMLHRNISKLGSNKNKKDSTTDKQKLHELIEFVEEVFTMGHSCLSPAATYQRKKTGLQLIELITNLYVYVSDIEKRRKGAATESFLSLLNYVHSTENISNKRWDFLSSTTTELLLCIEDQHDEIRELAVTVLLYQQSLLGRSEQLLSNYEMFSNIMNLCVGLLNSPRFHEVECGGCYIYFMAIQITESPQVGTNMRKFFAVKKEDSTQAILMFLKILINEGKKALHDSSGDFLLASMERPIYGYSMALSQVLRCLSKSHGKISPTNECLHELLNYCHRLSTVMVHLLAGTFTKGMLTGDSSMTFDTAPSIADIDKALDITITSSPCYDNFLKSSNHLYCRELLLSFCWLNLKSVSLIITQLGNLFHTNRDEAMIDDSSMEVIEDFFKMTLVSCLHKGVIETSYTSITRFVNSISTSPSLWITVSQWCRNVLSSSTDLTKHSSVTKRSAGIPMFIQSILSAEPVTENHELLHSTMAHLFEVARASLPKDVTSTYDLPQFNAINILRLIFRDTNLGNDVLRYVEEAVILTIDGFSSQSWSIRNASTQLLGTLVPRMLGQRLSQEEGSQQNMSTVDVFFYRYPKLLPFFESCLSQQETVMTESCLSILPHLIPVLTFLSKLRSTESQDIERLSHRFLSLLGGLKHSPVYRIRDLATSAILAFTSISSFQQIIDNYFENLTKGLFVGLPNLLHSSTLLVVKIVSNCNRYQRVNCISVIEHLQCDFVSNSICLFNYITKSLVIDSLVICVEALKDQGAILDCLCEYLSGGLILLRENSSSVLGIIGKPYFEKSVSKALKIVLCMSSDENVTQLLDLIVEWSEKPCNAYEHFMRIFFDDVNECLAKFSENVLKMVVAMITTSLMNNKSFERCESLLKCCSSLLVLNQSQVHTKFINSHLHDKSYPPVLLPCIARSMVIVMDKNEWLEEMIYFGEILFKHSHPENDENFRLAAAESLTVLHHILPCHVTRKEISQDLQNVLHRLLDASLNLLQDEDVDIRNKAATSLQFVHVGNDHKQNHVQCNIILHNLFGLSPRFKGSSFMFVQWLVHLLCKDDARHCHHNRGLMLFEQEASNLFAEEFQITNLSILAYQKTVDLILEKDENAFTELKRFHEQLYGHTLKLYDKTLRMEGCKAEVTRSMMGKFRERRKYNELYKCIELLSMLIKRRYIPVSRINADFIDLENSLDKLKTLPRQLSKPIDEIKATIKTY